ncbi:MAG: hypothetical protein EP332_01505 [Bacteroidetes bacterium]|nr:MAG: hypothetical protein EP332_01505 [Bacteroidota bacterium]
MFTNRYKTWAFKGILVLLGAHFFSCSSEQEPKLDYSELNRLSWLCGDWQATSEEGYSVEHWEKANDSTFLGLSMWIVDEDTSIEESLQLIQRNGVIYYIPTVPDQNEGAPVSFTLTGSQNSACVFENATHDFPQQISYSSIGQDSLVAEISGIRNGKLHSVQFRMRNQMNYMSN